MEKQIPNWVIPLAVVCAVVVLGIVLWKGMTATTTVPVGQDIAVRPGMYDLRAEMKKPRHSANAPDAHPSESARTPAAVAVKP